MGSVTPDAIPNAGVEWFTGSIPIDNELGLEAIDVASVFIHFSNILVKADKNELRFPISLYPPVWEERSKLEDQIILSAQKNADTFLVKSRTQNTNTEVFSYLVCERAQTHRASKKSGKENNEDGRPPIPQYKDGIRRDKIVNKAKASRGPQGKKEPRRTCTKKCECSFQIVLRLKVGQYWYMKNDLKVRGSHNHSKIAWAEKHRSMRSRSPEERELAAIFSQNTGSGSAMALTESITGTFPPSRSKPASPQPKCF